MYRNVICLLCQKDALMLLPLYFFEVSILLITFSTTLCKSLSKFRPFSTPSDSPE